MSATRLGEAAVEHLCPVSSPSSDHARLSCHRSGCGRREALTCAQRKRRTHSRDDHYWQRSKPKLTPEDRAVASGRGVVNGSLVLAGRLVSARLTAPVGSPL